LETKNREVLMKTATQRLIATVILLGGLMTFDLYAPPTAGTGGVSGTGAGCWPPPCIPIDGGIGFLLAAGLAFGGKKMLAAAK
jgi:hypothetical protein